MRLRFPLHLLFILQLALLAGCDETPTGRSQLALVPENLMAQMGEDTFDQLLNRQPVSRDTQVNELVQCVADKVVAGAEASYPGLAFPERWDVVVFEDSSPNAFALPGGRIGVHTGLLRVAETPAQLAAVIGHEVGHVLADHGNERLTQQLGIKAGLLVVGLLGEGELGHQQLMQALGIGAQIGISLPFSRTHEEEADLMGLAIMARSGFDPQESVALWRNMAATGGGQPPEFLSTHPAHESRIKVLETSMDEALATYENASPADCSTS
ncbi:M48 family metallopeptidase [Halomonas sp. 18H]|jgi:predicted Zn-dependent protease|uniref:M48 family metallopeptidase n=1 Tax=unclassified Halomonas TaxID=2609666 RepID=UPI000A28C313|nr:MULTISPECIES: M48 family metallopeptidase [unclassified Halomonas]MCW4148188.1 M48 family metallopeptidase [Halomonas sp. 18H]QPL44613.1 M48 family metallopeptidase [Halomonas sp. A40-4]